MELKVGEALVSMLENKGEPSIVQRTLIRPPEGRIGPVTADERRSIIEKSPVYGKYEDVQDGEVGPRDSAEEIRRGGAAGSRGGSRQARRGQ